VAVLSIRKYLTKCGTDSTNPLIRVCTLLLQGIARAALAYDREEYREFRATLDKLASTLETTQDPDELVTVAEAANEAMESYNRGAQRVHAAQTVELRCMIEMLSQTLVALAQSGSESIRTLQSIRNQVEGARQLDDIRLLRARLGDTLKSISEEARRQRERNAEMLRQAEEAAAVASGHNEAPQPDYNADRDGLDTDGVSGLPSAEKAEREITTRVGEGSRHYAAVFVVERVESLNLHYGYAAGDQLLQAFAKNLRSELDSADQVYRWRGPTFLVLLERSCPVDAVRTEVARFASSGPEYAMELGGRRVQLPLNCAWTVVELAQCQIAGQACRQIDRFVAEHWEKRGNAG
jgi:GGDEF domain-containing protein